jgi:hypothetical protein
MKLGYTSLLACTLSMASEALAPALYEITTETSMPHLEESLRYSTTQERKCFVRPAPLSTAFPVLSHVSLQDCRLEEEGRHGDVLSYRLACSGGHGTTGHATWELGTRQSRGTLHVKLGGKNMTFYQRVTVVPMGLCEGETK